MNFRYSKTLIPPMNQLSKICSMAWSPNNMRLAVACADRKIYLFNEQGENKDHFSTKGSGTKNYEVVEILFNPDSTKLAVAQSDNIIFVYKLGANWGDKKSICNKLEQSAKPTCMIWSRTKAHEIYFGLADGKVKVGLFGFIKV